MSRFGWAYVNDVITGSGGTPGGSDKAIQFASGSTFSGSTNFTFDYNTNTVRLTGTLYADNLIVSSSQILKSGSTIFGDDLLDTHQFTGSVYVTGVVSSSTGIQSAGAVTSQGIISSSLGFQTNTTVQAAGNIRSTSGDLSSSAGIQTGGFLTVAGTTNLKSGLIVTGSTIVQSLSSSAQIQATSFAGNGLGITGVQATNVDGAGDDWAVQFKSGDTGTLTGSSNLLFSGSTLTLTGSLLMSGTSYISEVDYIDFDVSASNPVYKQARLFHDTNTNDLSFYLPYNQQLQIGQQTVVKAKNLTGSPISKGKLVQIVGGVGDNPLINTASWENDANSANTIGMLMATVAHNNFGYVLLNGVITGVNTDPATFTAGQVIYLSSSGDYTATTPVAPKHTVRLGEVIRAHATVGSIFVKIDNGYEIGELHDVLITSASTGDLLTYNSSSALWQNTKTLSGSYTLTGSLSLGSTSTLSITSGTLSTGATVVSHTIPSNAENFVVSNEYNDKLITVESNATKDIVRIGPVSSTPGLTTEIYIQGNPGDAFLEVSPTTTFLSNLSGTTAQFTSVTASVVSASSYVGPVPKHAVFAASGITTGSNYEVITINGNKYLQLQKRRTFPLARSIGAADSEYGWTWLNRASISGSSTENTTVVSGANFVHAQVASTKWFPPTYTAPVRYRTYTLLAGQTMQVVAKIAATGSQNFDQVQLLVWASGSESNYMRIGVGYDVGTKIVTQYTSNTNVNTAISASQMLEGVWFTVNITEDNFSSYYNLSTSSTPPTTGWQYNAGGVFIQTTNHGKPLNVGQMIMNDHANPQTVTGSFKYFDVGITRNELSNFVNPNPYVNWPATQFDTSGTEQLIGEYDLGSSATVNETALRQLLADLTNNQYLENATITWSAVQSNSSGAASGTFYSSNAVVISGSGRYFRLWVKITSNGNQAGSIGPFPIIIPIS